MCLAIPAEVDEILPNERAVVQVGGIRKTISAELLDEVAVGDFVLVHVGYALEKINVEEAEETIRSLQKDSGSGSSEIRYPYSFSYYRYRS